LTIGILDSLFLLVTGDQFNNEDDDASFYRMEHDVFYDKKSEHHYNLNLLEYQYYHYYLDLNFIIYQIKKYIYGLYYHIIYKPIRNIVKKIYATIFDLPHYCLNMITLLFYTIIVELIEKIKNMYHEIYHFWYGFT
jgi:hypothetical protein